MSVMRENFSFYEGENLVIAFEDLLKRHNIIIKNKSNFEGKFLSVFDILFNYENRGKKEFNDDCRSLFRDFSAL